MKKCGLVAIFTLAAMQLGANVTGAPEGSTGAPGEQTCSACHGRTVNSGAGRVRIEFGETSSYVPAQKTRMRVVVEDPTARRWGFQLTARLESNSRTTAGTLATADGQTRVLRQSTLEWITHTLTGTRAGAAGGATFEFDWTAPATDSGTVVFYVAANAANNNGSNDAGDSIYSTALNVTAGGGGVRPTFTTESVAEAWTGTAGIAPGAWVTLTGADLAAKDANWSPGAGRAIETTLGGVVVKVNGVEAALASVSPTKIMFLAPAATPVGDVPIVVESAGRVSDSVMVRSSEVLPAIHSVADPSNAGRYYAAVTGAGAGTGLSLINPRGWILGKSDVDARASRGVLAGEEIDIYAIGLGRTDPEFPTDRIFAGTFSVVAPLTVRFGDLSVTPSSAVLVSPGLYVVRVKVPDSMAAGEVPLMLDFSGVTSSANIMLSVQAAQ